MYCRICKKLYKTKQLLMNHLSIHSMEDLNIKYDINYINKIFEFKKQRDRPNKTIYFIVRWNNFIYKICVSFIF